ncbi:uncharacterized protein LOC121665317 isoform X2 [Corvus kubaryi]|uniref:uncharacterized protein LOC121665317 isoform X2 n=1 Tax=Corvus kubaryi TaxID=68294 RepID=UPI001C0574F0|nr:uncharacterized protein LOC121665317 isoform X2 [Corvus kubaryi]
MAESPGSSAAGPGAPARVLRARSKEHPELPPHPHGQQECLPQLLFRNGNGCWELWQDQSPAAGSSPGGGSSSTAEGVTWPSTGAPRPCSRAPERMQQTLSVARDSVKPAPAREARGRSRLAQSVH